MDRNIDIEKCTLCGLCQMACPMGILEPGEKTMKFTNDAGEFCIRCGHCIAACPQDAVRIEGLDASQFPPLTGETIGYEQLQNLLLSRRSVRLFKDKPVEKEMVDRILAAVATAPSGENAGPCPVCVINGREKTAPMILPIMKFYRRIHRGMKGRVSRLMFRLMMGKDKYEAMGGFMPTMGRMFEYYDRTGGNVITWGAPLLLIFHAPRNSISCEKDAVISCTYAMLAAHAQGLGTTMIGMVPPFVDRNRDARRCLRIPDENTAVLSLIAGHPKMKFSRGIRRQVVVQWG